MILPQNPSDWPEAAYDVIYADPPWPYKDKAMQRGGAERHYETMTLEEICALPVGRLAKPNAHLFLWVTEPNQFLAPMVFEAWGIPFRSTAFCWVKTNGDNTIFKGMGHLTRQNIERCLYGRRGPIPARADKGIGQVRLLPRGSHSAKPNKFRRAIEALWPDASRVELFARGEHEGWDCWGNELEERGNE